MPRLDTAYVAGLFADRSRVAMVDVLMDSREHAVGALARAAGHRGLDGHRAPEPTGGREASSCVRRTGRQRLVQLAGPSVAAAYEALAELSHEREANGLRAWTRREGLRAARTCYDHLAAGSAWRSRDAALAAGAVEQDFSLGRGARAWFGELGVDLEAFPRARRPVLRVCTDWTERREHLAGALGAAICSAVAGRGLGGQTTVVASAPADPARRDGARQPRNRIGRRKSSPGEWAMSGRDTRGVPGRVVRISIAPVKSLGPRPP
jgi:hypothetical protein